MSGIASYNINLAAQTLNIGTMMNGFFVIAANWFNSIKKAAHIPRKAKILASICLGYPAIKYRKTVARRELDSKII